MGRVTQIVRPATAAGQLTEYYSYDGLGRRLKAWNNLYGASHQIPSISVPHPEIFSKSQ
jgi:hypothetical protein